MGTGGTAQGEAAGPWTHQRVRQSRILVPQKGRLEDPNPRGAWTLACESEQIVGTVCVAFRRDGATERTDRK